MVAAKVLPDLPCPECTQVLGIETWIRIGHRRNSCRTCNNFVRSVDRLALRRLREAHPEEYQALRLMIEADLYPQVMEDFTAR